MNIDVPKTSALFELIEGSKIVSTELLTIEKMEMIEPEVVTL